MRAPYTEAQAWSSLQSKLDRYGERVGDCLEWTGYRNPKSGYGQVSVPTVLRPLLHRTATAPQVSCWLHHGPRPEGQEVLHACDNPACFAPEHLSWGTTAQNAREAWDRGRQVSGEGHHRARLSDEQVAEAVARSYREPVRSVAAEFGVDWSTVYRWRRNETRKGVAA